MSEYIVDVPDEEAELFIARFGIEGTTLFGYRLADEIVRCRDCAFCNDEGVTQPIYFCLNDFFTPPANAFQTDPDGFCWRGVRRD